MHVCWDIARSFHTRYRIRVVLKTHQNEHQVNHFMRSPLFAHRSHVWQYKNCRYNIIQGIPFYIAALTGGLPLRFGLEKCSGKFFECTVAATINANLLRLCCCSLATLMLPVCSANNYVLVRLRWGACDARTSRTRTRFSFFNRVRVVCGALRCK